MLTHQFYKDDLRGIRAWAFWPARRLACVALGHKWGNIVYEATDRAVRDDIHDCLRCGLAVGGQ